MPQYNNKPRSTTTLSVVSFDSISSIFPNPAKNDIVFVLQDETKLNKSTFYIFDGTEWKYVDNSQNISRDFIKEPICLDKEITGVLSRKNYEKQDASEIILSNKHFKSKNIQDALNEILEIMNDLVDAKDTPSNVQVIQGPRGEQGPKGDKGDTGPQGIQGVKGDSEKPIFKGQLFTDANGIITIPSDLLVGMKNIVPHCIPVSGDLYNHGVVNEDPKNYQIKFQKVALSVLGLINITVAQAGMKCLVTVWGDK